MLFANGTSATPSDNETPAFTETDGGLAVGDRRKLSPGSADGDQLTDGKGVSHTPNNAGGSTGGDTGLKRNPLRHVELRGADLQSGTGNFDASPVLLTGHDAGLSFNGFASSEAIPMKLKVVSVPAVAKGSPTKHLVKRERELAGGSTSSPPSNVKSSPTSALAGFRHARFTPSKTVGGIWTSHEHHLKEQHRQEKLSRLFKDLLRKRDASDEDVDQAAADAVKQGVPPTLLQSLLEALQDQSAAAVEQLIASPKIFQERYGEISSVLGRGSYGTVKLASKVNPHDKTRRLVFAVKEYEMRPGKPLQEELKRVAAEICIASSLNHCNIVHTLDFAQCQDGRYCGILEYCAGGDLYSLIAAAGNLESAEADCFFKQATRGVAYMHEMGIAHRDLKPENMLLTTRGCLKITDFGNAECFRMAWEHRVHLSSEVGGSGPYISPEQFTKERFDPRPVDVWSLSVIYLSMRNGRQPWMEAKKSDPNFLRYLKDRKEASGYEPIEKFNNKQCCNVCYSMLDPVASRRLTAKQVLQSEWVRGIEVCKAGDGY